MVRSAWLALGPKTEEFERLIAEYVGVKHKEGEWGLSLRGSSSCGSR